MHARTLAMILPGQQDSLHDSSRVLLSVQGKPPHEGVGLLQNLVYVFIPSPHVTLHGPSVHKLHPPSTMEQSKMTMNCKDSLYQDSQ